MILIGVYRASIAKTVSLSEFVSEVDLFTCDPDDIAPSIDTPWWRRRVPVVGVRV